MALQMFPVILSVSNPSHYASQQAEEPEAKSTPKDEAGAVMEKLKTPLVGWGSWVGY